MKLCLTLLFSLPILSCLAQNPPPPAPPIRDSASAIQEADPDSVLTKVEIESEFPGGVAAWHRFLNRNQGQPTDNDGKIIQGTVVVQFIVDRNGRLSNIQAISGPEELRKEAVRLIRRSALWTPAIQHGRQVKAYKKVPIEFQLNPE